MPTLEEAYAEKYKRGTFSKEAKAAYEEAVQRGIYRAPKEMIDAPLLAPSETEARSGELAIQAADVRRQVMQETMEDIGPIQAFTIGMGKGFMDVGRGTAELFGADVGATPEEQAAMARLERAHPFATPAGEIVGESAPFVVPGVGAEMAISKAGLTGAAKLGARALAGGTIGGVEGATLAEDTGKGAVVGAGFGAGAEILFPIIGRLGNKIVQRVTGKIPVGAMLDAAGNPTQELQGALDKAGMTFADLTEDAQGVISQQMPGADPEQVARKALFEEAEVPISRGTLTQQESVLAKEAELMSDIESKAAQPYRDLKLEQSEAIKKKLNESFETEFTNTETGQLMKDALEGRYNLMSTETRELYEEAAKNVKELGSVPIFTKRIENALPDVDELEDLAITAGTSVSDLQTLLAKYGVIEPTEEIAGRIKNYTPLDTTNFERFRKSLNNISSSDNTGAVRGIVHDLKSSLDTELDTVGRALEDAGVADDIVDPFRKARAAHAKKKGEYSDKALAKQLIATGRDGVDQMIESSKVYSDKIASKAVPVERVRKLMKTLKAAGEEGEMSLEAMRTTTMLDLVNAGFGTKSKKIGGEQVFNPIAFRNRIESLGKDKIKAIFAGQKDVLKNLDNIEKIAEELTVSAELMPKGSAASPMFIRMMHRLGGATMATKVPLIGPIVMDAAEKSSQALKSGRNVKEVLNTDPDVARISGYLEETFPGIASAMGIATITDNNIMEGENVQ